MRTLTFRSFLNNYLRELSEQGTSAPFRLAKEISRNPRVLEPMVLYAALTMTEEQLVHLRKFSDKVNAEFLNNEFLTRPEEFESIFPLLPVDNLYRKCWTSYLSVRDKTKGELHTKQLYSQKIRRLQAERNVTNYRIYTDLNLNPGNLNAFLKHGDGTKVSLNTARKVLNYLQNMQ